MKKENESWRVFDALSIVFALCGLATIYPMAVDGITLPVFVTMMCFFLVALILMGAAFYFRRLIKKDRLNIRK